MNFHRFKNGRAFEEEIEKLLGKEIFPIQKLWTIGGVENDWANGEAPMEPEIEPCDPLSFVEMLELLIPDMTFLQFKRLEAHDIWATRVWTANGSKNNNLYIYAAKEIDTQVLLETLKVMFPE